MKLVAIFLISFAVCGANAAQRPAWIGKGTSQAVDTLFKKATPFSYKNYKHPTIPNRPPHLAHVVSWKGIETIVNAWNKAGKQAAWDLRPFAEYLFEVDTEACVYNPNNPKHTCVPHTKILNNNKGALMKKNTAMRTKVLAEINKNQPDIDEIKKLLNSAPANLRYGSTQINGNIQGWLDPLGDNTNGLTTKEKSLIYVTDDKCFNYNKPSLISSMNPPFIGYATYFKKVIVKKVNDAYFLRGTLYDPSTHERTTKNHIFYPTNKAGNKLYVLSSSQAGYCTLGTLLNGTWEQNTLGDTIKYYVKNV